MPLSVGYESDAEYFDIEVAEALSSADVMERMNREQAEGIEVSECVKLPDGAENAMASVRAADYIVGFRQGNEPPFDIKGAISGISGPEPFIAKKPVKRSGRKGRISKASYNTRSMNDKAGEEMPEYREIDIRPFILGITCGDDGRIRMKVSAGSKDNIKPELVIGALYERAGYELPPHALMITRHELYTDEGDGNGKELIPLYKAGERF